MTKPTDSGEKDSKTTKLRAPQGEKIIKRIVLFAGRESNSARIKLGKSTCVVRRSVAAGRKCGSGSADDMVGRECVGCVSYPSI